MIQVVVESADVLAFPCDALLLKHAQAFYGADAQVEKALTWSRPGAVEIRPRPGEHVLVASEGAVAADHVLFLGVVRLALFDYAAIRAFTTRALTVVSDQLPHARHVAMTIHGVGYGLDEREVFLAQLGGILDAERAGVSVERVSIVELHPGRAARLKTVLQERWQPSRARPATAQPPNTPQPITAGPGSLAKPHVFVAMPFTKELEDVYVFGIQGPVNAAGYLCERVDTSVFTGDILGRIKSRIETAALVVADLTGANANVYLEVGYAWGKGRPTLLLVRQVDDLKFDVRGQRCIVYENIVDLSRKMQADLARLGPPS
jgi:hypothetical protein